MKASCWQAPSWQGRKQGGIAYFRVLRFGYKDGGLDIGFSSNDRQSKRGKSEGISTTNEWGTAGNKDEISELGE